jgi:tungstate transport system ATP-binding protein
MSRHRYESLLYALEGLTQEYGGRTVLSVDFLAIRPQSIVGLAGHNGSGKSTLLRILAFLEEPARGKFIFEGKPSSTRQDGLGRKVTLLPQEPYLLKRSVRDNVAYGLKVRGTKDPGKRVAEVLNMVGLPPEEFSRRSWHQLSGGEAQRVALAARLVLRPQILLLDEPTTSLDVESTRRIKEASLAARKDWGATLVVVSHDMAWLESVCDKILVLADGRLVRSG